MKYLIIALFALTGCGPADLYNLVGHRRFAVGDCLIQSSDEPEPWQNKPDYKVLEIGNNHYLVKNLEHYSVIEISFGHLWEDFYQKVSCGDSK